MRMHACALTRRAHSPSSPEPVGLTGARLDSLPDQRGMEDVLALAFEERLSQVAAGTVTAGTFGTELL
eukprot:7060914-Alexandrium_andersonii.AAC.1